MPERQRLILAVLLLPLLWIFRATDSFEFLALVACGFGVTAGFFLCDVLVAAAGVMLGGAVLWLWASCGFPRGMGEAGARLNATFDRFDAALPLVLVLGCAAIWLMAVPVVQALRGKAADRDRLVIAGCVVPMVGFMSSGRVVGSLVVRGEGTVGWSAWQDVVAQFCLPVGAVAAVGCGVLALLTCRDVIRLALWTSALSGGLVLMALGRADAGGISVGLALALAQWVVVGIWVLVEGPGGQVSGWRAWAAAGCAASLAGVWPLPGGLARWRLLEEMWGGGFGMEWDRALLVALVLSWVLALVAWAARTWRSLDQKFP